MTNWLFEEIRRAAEEFEKIPRQYRPVVTDHKGFFRNLLCEHDEYRDLCEREHK